MLIGTSEYYLHTILVPTVASLPSSQKIELERNRKNVT